MPFFVQQLSVQQKFVILEGDLKNADEPKKDDAPKNINDPKIEMVFTPW